MLLAPISLLIFLLLVRRTIARPLNILDLNKARETPKCMYPWYAIPGHEMYRKGGICGINHTILEEKFGPVQTWDVSYVRDMSYMFHDITAFNGDISRWDVSRVTDMSYMFRNATAFNGDLSKWDVSRVTDMKHMFHGAHAFNADLSKWDITGVTDMSHLFYDARVFNADVSKWDPSQVPKMEYLVRGASVFNADLSKWSYCPHDYFGPPCQRCPMSFSSVQDGLSADAWARIILGPIVIVSGLFAIYKVFGNADKDHNLIMDQYDADENVAGSVPQEHRKSIKRNIQGSLSIVISHSITLKFMLHGMVFLHLPKDLRNLVDMLIRMMSLDVGSVFGSARCFNPGGWTGALNVTCERPSYLDRKCNDKERYDFLFSKYQKKDYFWESVTMGRKLLFAIFGIYFTNNFAVGLILCIVCNSGVGLAIILRKPFLYRVNNNLELVMLTGEICLCGAALGSEMLLQESSGVGNAACFVLEWGGLLTVTSGYLFCAYESIKICRAKNTEIIPTDSEEIENGFHKKESSTSPTAEKVAAEKATAEKAATEKAAAEKAAAEKAAAEKAAAEKAAAEKAAAEKAAAEKAAAEKAAAEKAAAEKAAAEKAAAEKAAAEKAAAEKAAAEKVAAEKAAAEKAAAEKAAAEKAAAEKAAAEKAAS
eukprot:g2285.t1